MQKYCIIQASICIAALGLLAPASASSAGEPAPGGGAEQTSIVDSLFACHDIADPTARLDCYDREVAAVKKAKESNELLIADKGQMQEMRRGLFGLSLPKIKFFGSSGGDDKEGLNQIEARIASAGQTRDGKLVLVLEDGARWVQTDNTLILGHVQEGDTVTIKRAAFGSFMAKIPHKRGFRIKRVK